MGCIRRTSLSRSQGPRSPLGPLLLLLPALVLQAPLSGCAPEKPPAPEQRGGAETPAQGAEAAPETARLVPERDKAVLTFAGERGAFQDTNALEKVPEEARGMVRVSLLDGPRPAPGKVWVANLKAADEDGGYTLTTVPRDQYEELALGQGRSSQVTLPEGLEPPEVKPREADVIVYKTDWCGVCKQLIAYLDRKGVPYVAKDIEKDRAAAAELQAKATEKGLKTGSVPVIDVRGEVMVGFNRARLEQIL
ncbi:MAG: glutaredoxin family protein [Myxococcales bacterium]|nr:glutaredoxin family protein [Myxococcales bacterium]